MRHKPLSELIEMIFSFERPLIDLKRIFWDVARELWHFDEVRLFTEKFVAATKMLEPSNQVTFGTRLDDFFKAAADGRIFYRASALDYVEKGKINLLREIARDDVAEALRLLYIKILIDTSVMQDIEFHRPIISVLMRYFRSSAPRLHLFTLRYFVQLRCDFPKERSLQHIYSELDDELSLLALGTNSKWAKAQFREMDTRGDSKTQKMVLV